MAEETKDRAAQCRPEQVKRIWRRFLLLIPLLVVLVFGSFLYIKSAADMYTLVGFVSYDESVALTNDSVRLSNPDVVRVDSVERTSLGTARITFSAVSDGVTTASIGSAAARESWQLEVRSGAIIESGINFSGWESIHASLCIFLAATIALFATALWRLHRRSWYGYEMVACTGGLLFCLFQFVLLAALFFIGNIPTFWNFLLAITSTVQYFVLVSLFPMALIALLLAASNISLIRHEGLRPVNMLGIAFGFAWALVNVLFLVLSSSWDGLGTVSTVLQYINALITIGIAFGECLLIATMLCAWLASRHVPQHGMDYLIVLGCGIRADGTPFPLLARRIDCAMAFDAQRVKAGDEPAVFVCSGGQGPDEPISEAQSMSDYLQGKGVLPERIVLEGRSSTTNENMAFSREAIEERAHCDANALHVGFSTTNYHVFRGYVCAHKAGMAVEGMGSKTRLYFWPNAFLREFAGLLAWQWKTILQTYIVIALIHLFFTYVLGVI